MAETVYEAAAHAKWTADDWHCLLRRRPQLTPLLNH